MNQTLESILAGIITGAFQIWANHMNKPEGWKPTAEDVQALLDMVDADTPEAIKAEAAARLGVTWPPVV